METTVGPSGAECYRIQHESGSEVVIAQLGGHIISWKTADGIERFYLSDLAEFKEGNAIRGGVPVIFPQFNANGPLGRHGFARKAVWTPDYEENAVKLCSSAATRAEWPHDFEIAISVELSASTLKAIFTVRNTGESPFPFQAALHSYFKVGDVTSSAVKGLEGLEFSNEVTGNCETAAEESSGILFGSEVDRSYRDSATRSQTITEDGAPICEIDNVNFPDVVVWNPGPNHGIGDLSQHGWKDFICVEAAQVQSGSPLDPGDTWRGEQKISVLG